MMSESDVAATDVHALVVDADLVQVFPVDGKQPPGNGGHVQGLWLRGYGYGSGYGKDLQTWRGPSPSPRSGVMYLNKDVPGVRGLREAGVGVQIQA